MLLDSDLTLLPNRQYTTYAVYGPIYLQHPKRKQPVSFTVNSVDTGHKLSSTGDAATSGGCRQLKGWSTLARGLLTPANHLSRLTIP